MSKVVIERKQNVKNVINKLSYPETINERVYNAILSGVIEGLFPVSVNQKGKETRVECSVCNMVSLSEYVNGVVTKEVFLDIVEQLIEVVSKCDEKLLNPGNLELNKECIFIEPNTRKVKCIYWPIVNNQRENPPHLFLKQMGQELKFYPYEDMGYVDEYNAFFARTMPFSLNDFRRLICKLHGKEAERRTGMTTNTFSESAMNSGSKEKRRMNSKDIAYDPFASVRENEVVKTNADVDATKGIYCPQCGNKNSRSGTFCGFCGTKMRESIKEETVEAIIDTGEDRTMLLDPVEEALPLPVIIRVKTNEMTVMGRHLFRMGASKYDNELTIQGNVYISRWHAEIIARDGKYYLKDKNSKNKTYVDEVALEAGQEAVLAPGSRFKLADEEFIFEIE